MGDNPRFASAGRILSCITQRWLHADVVRRSWNEAKQYPARMQVEGGEVGFLLIACGQWTRPILTFTRSNHSRTPVA